MLMLTESWQLFLFCVAQNAAADGRSNNGAKLKLYIDGKEVVHFPATVYGNELLQVEAIFPAGEPMLSRTTFPLLCVFFSYLLFILRGHMFAFCCCDLFSASVACLCS